MTAGPIGRAGLAYWAMIFALGFVLGTVRVLSLEPALGPLAATMVELPVMLLASLIAAAWLVRRFAIAAPAPALAMGGIAFVLLMSSELALATLLSGNSPSQWIAEMATPPGALGLAGQAGFGLMPWLVTASLTRR